jgi:hypothetical protein
MGTVAKSFRRRLERLATVLHRSVLLKVVAFGLVFSALVLLVHLGVPRLSLTTTTAKLASAAFLFGVFLAVIYLTERLRSPLEATIVRTAVGAVVGSAVAVVLGASLLVVLVAIFVGGLLGYLGMAWAGHV